MSSCLEVSNLKVAFRLEGKDVTVVDDVSFEVGEGEVVGLVGESGCGKSVTAMSLVSLLPTNSSKRLGGKVILNGTNISELSEKELQAIRGAQVGFIFQEPMSSLNPVLTIGYQLKEALQLHQDIKDEEADQQVAQMLKLVGISNPELRTKQFPHELSGGLRQRVMIAMALICKPRLLIADEPTTALDVTIQAQILDLLRKLQAQLKMSILLITHDLGVVAENCDRVIVMYAGKIVESAPVRELYANPLMPYTYGLLASVPRLGEVHGRRLSAIGGQPPSLIALPAGCAFAPRCSFKERVADNAHACAHQMPALTEHTSGHFARCHLEGAKL